MSPSLDISGINSSNVNIVNSSGFLPIHLAAGDDGPVDRVYKIVKYLLSLNSHVHVPDSLQRLPSQIAWEFGNRNAFRLIIEHANKVGALSTIQERSLFSKLHIAVILDLHDEFYKILEEASDSKTLVNLTDVSGATPLHHAASTGNSEFVAELIRRGSDVNAQDIKGRTPIYITAGEGRLEAAKLLIARGAEITKNRPDGGSTIGCAALNGNADTLKLLIETVMSNRDLVYDPDATTCGCGAGALHHAPNAAVAKVLIETGSNVNSVKSYRSPLGEAVDQKKPDVVKVLLENGANVNQKGIFGTTALIEAIKGGDYEIIKLLIEHGAVTNDFGNPALKVACQYDLPDPLAIVRLLIDNGAVPTTSAFEKLVCAQRSYRFSIFEVMFEMSSNDLKSNAWNVAVKYSDKMVCWKVLLKFVGYHAGWKEETIGGSDVQSTESNKDSKWIPRKPVELVEKLVWRRHYVILYKWICKVALKEEFPVEILYFIENWL